MMMYYYKCLTLVFLFSIQAQCSHRINHLPTNWWFSYEIKNRLELLSTFFAFFLPFFFFVYQFETKVNFCLNFRKLLLIKYWFICFFLSFLLVLVLIVYFEVKTDFYWFTVKNVTCFCFSFNNRCKDWISFDFAPKK